MPAAMSHQFTLQLFAPIALLCDAFWRNSPARAGSGSGYAPVGGTPEQFAELIRKETGKWGKIIKTAGTKSQ